MTLLAALQKTTKALRDLCVDGQNALIMTEDPDVRIASLYLGPAPAETVIEDCEDAWTAEANVTCDVDAADYKVGTKSATMDIAAGFSAGLVAGESITVDASGQTHVALWIKANAAIAAGVFSLLLDEHAAFASPEETFDLPAMEADTWYHFVFPCESATATRNALILVGITANSDPGAVKLWVDDVRATSLNRTAKNLTLPTSGTWETVLPHAGIVLTDAEVTPDFTARWMSASVDKDMLITLVTSEDEADLFVPANATYELPWPVEITQVQFSAAATVDGYRFFFAGRG